MRLSIVTNKDSFIEYLEKKTTGMKVVNRYTSLADSTVFERFSNDFNKVQTFMFIDLQDLSKEFKAFLDFIHDGKSYFLSTEEVLIVTLKDPLMSPTPDIEKNLEAIEAFLEKTNIKVRIVKLEALKFKDIYNSITINDSMMDNAPKTYIKYKVLHNEEGISIPPKKANVTIIPDKLKGTGSVHKKDDLHAARSLQDVTIRVPDLIEPVRTSKDFKDFVTLAVTDTTVVFVTGLRYSGKTSIALKCAKELEEQNLTSAIMDLTGRQDLKLLNRTIKCDLGVPKGIAVDSVSANMVVGLNVINRVYTPTFITHLLKSFVNSRTVTFCEVDPEELAVMYKSFIGNKLALVVIPNTSTMVRDTTILANNLDFPIAVITNNSFNTKTKFNKEALQSNFTNCKAVFDTEDIPELVHRILK